jgi:hypothetical protein
MNYCCYGCGQEGKVAFTSFYKLGLFRCAKSHTQCPAKEQSLKDASRKAMLGIGRDGLIARSRKRLMKMNFVGEDGLTTFQRAAKISADTRRSDDGTYRGAEKTRATKRAAVDANGLDAFDRAGIKTAITRFGHFGGLNKDEKFRAYRRQVIKHTLRQDLTKLKYFERRGAIGKVDDPYHIDHRISVAFGYRNEVPASVIGHLANLQMLPALENNSKGANCSLTLEALMDHISAIS